MTLFVPTQIPGPPFSPLPPGAGGIPGVRTPRLLQGGPSDAQPERAPGPSLQQRRDRVDHEGAGGHSALRPAHPGGVKHGAGGVRVEAGTVCDVVLLLPAKKLTTKSNPCLQQQTPLDSSCGQISVFVHVFILLVVCSWTILKARGYSGFREEQTLPALYVSDTRGRFLNSILFDTCPFTAVVTLVCHRLVFIIPNILFYFFPSFLGTYFSHNLRSGQCLYWEAPSPANMHVNGPTPAKTEMWVKKRRRH